MPENMKLKLLEPLRDLFKDEVRELGVALVYRAKWCTATPSRPGLGVRILGEVKKNTPTCCVRRTIFSSKNYAILPTKTARLGMT